MHSESQVPVVVLHFNHGGLGAARSLGRLGVPVHAVSAESTGPAWRSRYLSGRHIWDFGRMPAEASVEFLLGLGQRVGQPSILLPSSDDTALLVAEHADALAERFIFPRNSSALVRSFSNKRDLYYLARSLDIPVPETSFPQSRHDVCKFAEDAAFPVMLKAADGLRLQARTGKKMMIIRSAAELLDQYDRLEDPDEPDLMLQEYIPGGDDTIWMFNGYFDDDSTCLGGFTGRKLRQHPVHVGATSLGELCRNDQVSTLTCRLAKAVGYRGILDIGFRYDARDGSYKLLDPNPRLGSTFRLFVGADGVDVVRMMYLHLTGQPVPPVVPRHGRKWLVEDQDLESSLDYVREGSLGLGSWLRSFRGVEEAAWFAHDDLGPFALMLRRLSARGLRKLTPRLGRRSPARSSQRVPAGVTPSEQSYSPSGALRT